MLELLTFENRTWFNLLGFFSLPFVTEITNANLFIYQTSLFTLDTLFYLPKFLSLSFSNTVGTRLAHKHMASKKYGTPQAGAQPEKVSGRAQLSGTALSAQGGGMPLSQGGFLPSEGGMPPSEGGILPSEGGMPPSKSDNLPSEGSITPIVDCIMS